MNILLNEVEAYHGSPYDFEKFDVSAIGSGEGFQAHGWGLYFALHDETSKGYQDRLSGSGDVLGYEYNGKVYYQGSVWFKLINLLKAGTRNEAIDYLNKLLNNERFREKYPDYKEKITKLIDEVNQINLKSLENPKKAAGQFYTVEIPELDYYLDENREFVQQPTGVKNILKKIVDENPRLGLKLDRYYGKQIYNRISDKLGGDKKASQFLYKYGIVGISYYGGHDGPCVVIFNDKDVKILSKMYTPSSESIDLPDEDKILENPFLIGKIQNPSDELVAKAISINPESIKYVKNPSEENQLLALKKSLNIVGYIDNLSEKAKKYWLKNASNKDKLKHWKILSDAEKKDFLLNNFNYITSYDVNTKIEEMDDDFQKKLFLKYPDDYLTVTDNSSSSFEIAINSLNELKKDRDDIIYRIKERVYESMFKEFSSKTQYLYLIYTMELSFLTDVSEDVAIKVLKYVLKKKSQPDHTYRYGIDVKNMNLTNSELALLVYKIIMISNETVDIDNYDFLSKLSKDELYNLIEKYPSDYGNTIAQYFGGEYLMKYVEEFYKKYDESLFRGNSKSKMDIIKTLLYDEKYLGLFEALLKKDVYLGNALFAYFVRNNGDDELSKPVINVITKYKPDLVKFIYMDEKQQMKLVKKNPYNIKLIRNPSKKVLDYLKSEGYDMTNYIRK